VEITPGLPDPLQYHCPRLEQVLKGMKVW